MGHLGHVTDISYASRSIAIQPRSLPTHSASWVRCHSATFEQRPCLALGRSSNTGAFSEHLPSAWRDGLGVHVLQGCDRCCVKGSGDAPNESSTLASKDSTRGASGNLICPASLLPPASPSPSQSAPCDASPILRHGHRTSGSRGTRDERSCVTPR